MLLTTSAILWNQQVAAVQNLVKFVVRIHAGEPAFGVNKLQDNCSVHENRIREANIIPLGILRGSRSAATAILPWQRLFTTTFGHHDAPRDPPAPTLPSRRATSSGESRRRGSEEDERAYVPQGAARKPEGVLDDDELRRRKGVWRIAALEFP